MIKRIDEKGRELCDYLVFGEFFCCHIKGHKTGHTRSESSTRAVKNAVERDKYRAAKGVDVRSYEKRQGLAPRRMWVGLLKLAYGCKDCGYRVHHEALQFDHLPGSVKLGEVNKLVKSASAARLFAEIAKCEIVCANCHAVRTATRRSAQLQAFLVLV